MCMCIKVWLLKIKRADSTLSHLFLLSASICHSHCFLSAVCVLLFVSRRACIYVCVVVSLCCHAESSCTMNVLCEPKGHAVLNTSAGPTPRQQSSTLRLLKQETPRTSTTNILHPSSDCLSLSSMLLRALLIYETSDNVI